MLLVYLYFPLNAAERKCLYSPKFGWKIYLFTEILLYSPQCWWLGISVYPWMLRCRVAVPYQQVAAVAEDYQLQRYYQHYSCSSVLNHTTAAAASSTTLQLRQRADTLLVMKLLLFTFMLHSWAPFIIRRTLQDEGGGWESCRSCASYT